MSVPNEVLIQAIRNLTSEIEALRMQIGALREEIIRSGGRR